MTVIWTSECATCNYRPPTGEQVPQICTRCRGRLRANLADLPALYRRLADVMIPGTGTGPKVSGTKTPPLPARIGPLDLRSPGARSDISRSELEAAGRNTDHLDDMTGDPPLIAVLLSWEADIRLHFTYNVLPFRGTTEQTIRASVDWLTKQLDKICDEHPAAEPFYDAIKTLHYRCLQQAGELKHMVVLGPCPNTFDGDGQQVLDDQGQAVACGYVLRAEPDATSGVTCRECGEYYSRQYFLWLRAQAEAAEAS